MIRMRKVIRISVILLFLTLLTACDGMNDLFKQKQEQISLVEGQESEKEDSDQIEQNASGKQLQEDENSSADQAAQWDAMETLGENEQQLFYYEEITEEIKARIVGKSYAEDCKVPFAELRYVSVLHRGFDGETHVGELIVNKSIAADIVEIFKELYEQNYPIEQMVLIDEYDAEDNSSMEANNTSAFNYRVIDDGSGRLSLHSYGLAIDINPLYNPYVRVVDGETVVSPENGEAYEDRTLDCPYYIDTDDPCYKAFTQRGFTWGGDWKNQKDYQHFQKALQ